MYEPPLELYAKCRILQEPLSLDKTILKEQLIETQSLQYEVSYTRTVWLEKLYKARERVKLPKDREFTELDRRTHLEANTGLIEKDLEFLQALESIVVERLSLGKKLL